MKDASGSSPASSFILLPSSFLPLLPLIALLFLAAENAAGQTDADGPRLITQLRWVEVNVSGGRIRATSSYTGRRITASNKGSGRSEELSVDVSGGAVNLDYKLMSKESSLSIAITGGDEVYIRCEPSGAELTGKMPVPRGTGPQPVTQDAAPAVEFLQPASGPVVLIVPEDGRSGEHEAPSLWHLLLAEPKLCERELNRLLRPLRPDWQLVTEARAIETELLRVARAIEPPDYQSWTAWVAELASEESWRRRAADRCLRDAGRAALPYLRGLDRQRLDAEQRFRIRRIVTALGGTAGYDTPESVAAWLASDPRTWLIFLASDNESRRRLAADQLSHAWGGQIAFDPAADEQTRAVQIEQLRRRVE